MIEVKVRMWRTVGVALATGMAACAPGGEAGEDAKGEAAQHGEAGEAATGETGAEAGHGGAPAGEQGEAGAVGAYAGAEGPARTALRLHHLKGFLVLASELQKAGKTDEAAALIGQAALEISDPAPTELGALDAGLVRVAANAAPAEAKAALRTAIDATEVASAAIPADAVLVGRLLSLTRGLYAEVNKDGLVDPIEYQHSLGAMLGATAALARLPAKDNAAKVAAVAEMARLRALWPALEAPETPTPAAEVMAQIARVELALSQVK